MDLIVISHFYNEELLLPYWLKHHTKIFDFGILIDYDSTDRSVEIVRELAPHWELRRSNNKDFSATQCDMEVMHIERQFAGAWKIALNTTEFVIHPDVRGYANDFTYTEPDKVGFRLTGCVMVESADGYDTPLDESIPLMVQRHQGYVYPDGPRNRIIHKAHDGAYLAGRHSTMLEDRITHTEDEVYCLWYGFSPYPQVKQRKLQIQSRIPDEDKKRGFGVEHLVSETELESKWESNRLMSYDLLKNEKFSKVYHDTLNSLYGD